MDIMQRATHSNLKPKRYLDRAKTDLSERPTSIHECSLEASHSEARTPCKIGMQALVRIPHSPTIHFVFWQLEPKLEPKNCSLMPTFKSDAFKCIQAQGLRKRVARRLTRLSTTRAISPKGRV